MQSGISIERRARGGGNCAEGGERRGENYETRIGRQTVRGDAGLALFVLALGRERRETSAKLLTLTAIEKTKTERSKEK